MNPKKAIIFDAGAIISLSMNGLLDELVKLKKIFNGNFLITKQVRNELIGKPIKIKRFELEALKAQKLLEDKVLEEANSCGISDSLIESQTKEMMDTANGIFGDKVGNINIMQIGEASCLALSRILQEKGIDNVIVIDERTTRMLAEKPENLRNLLRKKLHAKITFLKKDFKHFENFKIIRSAELMYIAWKKGLLSIKKGNVLDAVLYALKSKGCSISETEIDEIKRLK